MTSNNCRICQTPMLGSHYHEAECRECGLDFGEPRTQDIDESGTPYCVACGANPLDGVAWSTSGGLVVVIPDPEIAMDQIRQDLIDYPNEDLVWDGDKWVAA